MHIPKFFIYTLPGVSPAAGAMLHTTLAFTMVYASEGRNVLPEKAWVIGDMRFSHHQGEVSILVLRMRMEI